MKIEIITERKPFFDGKACEMGQIIDCNAKEGRDFISKGFGFEVQSPKKTADKK
tara:strand:- start:648 stop:809 length:162 start_codon:yes stop_codon:yes gene_type:complete